MDSNGGFSERLKLGVKSGNLSLDLSNLLTIGLALVSGSLLYQSIDFFLGLLQVRSGD